MRTEREIKAKIFEFEKELAYMWICDPESKVIPIIKNHIALLEWVLGDDNKWHDSSIL